jgi:hypothetical protein
MMVRHLGSHRLWEDATRYAKFESGDAFNLAMAKIDESVTVASSDSSVEKKKKKKMRKWGKLPGQRSYRVRARDAWSHVMPAEHQNTLT